MIRPMSMNIIIRRSVLVLIFLGGCSEHIVLKNKKQMMSFLNAEFITQTENPLPPLRDDVVQLIGRVCGSDTDPHGHSSSSFDESSRE
jgi:hypothetical protein